MWQSTYLPVKALSVPALRSTPYCSVVKRLRHCSSERATERCACSPPEDVFATRDRNMLFSLAWILAVTCSPLLRRRYRAGPHGGYCSPKAACSTRCSQAKRQLARTARTDPAAVDARDREYPCHRTSEEGFIGCEELGGVQVVLAHGYAEHRRARGDDPLARWC